MACRFEYQGKSYSPDELVDVLRNMDPKDAAPFIPGVNPLPPMPMSKTWHELALKRALREAAEKGYDRLSWTPGDAQAARYDLSKSIDQINYDRKSGYLEAVDKDGRKHIGSTVPENQLADHIGKEAAEKLLNVEPNQKGVSILRNADLKIGGEGMRGFYDQIIPKALEKLTKGHGVKVQKAPLSAAPKYEIKNPILNKDGHEVVSVYKDGTFLADMLKSDADSYIASRKEKDAPQTAWYIDIPQSLKDQARSKGFALFQDSGIGAPLAGSDDMKRARGGSIPHMADGGLLSDDDMGVTAPVLSDSEMGVTTAKEDSGALSAAGRGAYQGATFGFGDELRGIGEAGGVKPDEWNNPLAVARGAVRYWGGDKDAEAAYDAAVKREREANAAAKEQHPYAYMGGEFAGAIPSMAALPGGMAARGATLGARMGQGAIVGAEYGALAGAGEGTDAASRGVGAGAGAVAGGVGGAGAAPATEAAGYLLRRTLGPVWNSVAGLIRGPEAEAARRVFNAAEADSADIMAGKMTGLTPQQWQAAKAAGEPVTLADFGGARTQSLLRSAANTSPEGRGILEKVINDRFEGQAERVAKDVRNLVSGGANAHKTADQLVAEYDLARVPAYRKAFAQPGAQGMWDDEFAQIAEAPVVQQAIRMASVNGRNEAAKLGLPQPMKPFQFNRDGSVALSDPNFTPNLQFWDVVKKNLDKMGADGAAWSKVLRGKLDEAVPEYANARGIAAQFFGESDALQAGRALAGKKVDPQTVAGVMRKMSPEEKDLFREGFASDWAGRVIGNFRDSRDITKAMFNSPNEREMARIIFGDAGMRKLEARMTLEAVMDGARKAMGNSTTARQLIEAGLAGGALTGYATGWDPRAMAEGAGAAAGARKFLATEMASGARKLIGKVDAKTAARVAELLTSDDPRKLAQGMRIMVSNQRVADGMRAIADRLANSGQARIPRLQIDTTGWGGALPARADQQQDQSPGLGNQ